MFKVVMVACNVFGQCIGIEDNLGPYDTAEACEERRAELLDIFEETPIWPVPYKIGSGCEPVEPDGVAL